MPYDNVQTKSTLTLTKFQIFYFKGLFLLGLIIQDYIIYAALDSFSTNTTDCAVLSFCRDRDKYHNDNNTITITSNNTINSI